MLTRRIIPCLDVRNGRVVKGVRFQNLRDSGDPQELAAAYEEQGADELVLLDVSATTESRRAQVETIERVRAVLSIPLTVGGGVRTIDDVAALLGAGADKVSVNTAAVDRPSLLAAMAERFGVQCTVLAIDAVRKVGGREWDVAVRSGAKRTGISAAAWAICAQDLGAGEVLLTSWDRDGTREGYDLALIEAVRCAVNLPIIASGGAASPQHLLGAVLAGADAVLAASIFHDGEYTINDVKAYLAEAAVEVRP